MKFVILLNARHCVINLNYIFLIYNSQRSFSLMCNLNTFILVFDLLTISFKSIVIIILNRLELRIKCINLYFFKTKVTSCVNVYF